MATWIIIFFLPIPVDHRYTHATHTYWDSTWAQCCFVWPPTFPTSYVGIENQRDPEVKFRFSFKRCPTIIHDPSGTPYIYLSALKHVIVELMHLYRDTIGIIGKLSIAMYHNKSSNSCINGKIAHFNSCNTIDITGKTLQCHDYCFLSIHQSIAVEWYSIVWKIMQQYWMIFFLFFISYRRIMILSVSFEMYCHVVIFF